MWGSFELAPINLNNIIVTVICTYYNNVHKYVTVILTSIISKTMQKTFQNSIASKRNELL